MKSKIGVCFLAVIFALAGISSFLPANGHSAEPIKFVDLSPTSGVMKDLGDRNQMGVRFAVEEINAAGGLLGRPIKVFYEDSQVKPDVASRKLIRAIEEEKVPFAFVSTGTHVAKAMAQVCEKNKVVLTNYASAGDDLTGKDFSPYHFRMCLSTSQQSGALAAYFSTKPYKKYYLFNPDYAFGYEVSSAFKRAMKRMKPDWQLMGEDYHPLGAKDVGAYVSKMISSGAEVLITGDFGVDLRVLIKQSASLGLKAKIGTYYLCDPFVMQEIGEAAIGSMVAEMYLLNEDTPKNKAFIERWKKRNMDASHPYPAWQIGKGYMAVMFLAEAIKKAKSTNSADVIKAWEGLSYEGLVGRMTMRACDHQVITPVTLGEAVPGPGAFYKFPWLGKLTQIPADKAAVPPEETGNARCEKK